MSPSIARSQMWRWWVCGLLLLATMINYMDRLTLNLLAKYILEDLQLDVRHYASIEAGFALAFAGGAILCGFIVDRWNVFWVYPFAVLAWSAAGFFTGFAAGFSTLLLCRVLLGLAEAANWPCALRTTQRILPPSERSMGNSILQSGAAVGAILIPIVMFLLFDEQRIETWRLPFFVVGAAGTLWVVFWWASVRPADLSLAPTIAAARQAGPGLPAWLAIRRFAVLVVLDLKKELTAFWLCLRLAIRRFAVLVVLVVTINMTWHFLRAWGPLFLQERHGFNAPDIFRFSIGYYVFTDLGALTAGYISLRLARRGLTVFASRALVFAGCALLTTLCLLVPFLPTGIVLVGAMLAIGFGALGVFPNYYSFSQDLTTRHQGKLTGTLGCCCWLAMAIWQKSIGWIVHETGSYTVPFVISGLAPLFGFLVLMLLWGNVEEPAPPRVAAEPAPVAVAAETGITAGVGAVQPGGGR